MVNLPAYYLSPEYTKSQTELGKVGYNLLSGDIPSYLAPIGESGGSEFERMLQRLRGGAEGGAISTAARLGQRGGNVAGAASSAVANVEAPLRWQDYTRALQGRQYLFGEGRGITEGIRGAGLTESSLKNQYNLNKAEMDLKNEEIARQEKQAKASMWANILSSGIGSIANMWGVGQLSDILKGSGTTGKLGSAMPESSSSFWNPSKFLLSAT